ncbi:MAG TPA: PDDEXK nuclease domain-containing protein [Chlamydiales bacterium]|nr:PDDEXK nuclease domain-containing protein [Chlamydiales bacterium]
MGSFDSNLNKPIIQVSIGIILCKEKDRTVVEYTLKQANKPIGVATYEMFRELPKELKNELPSPEQIARLLDGIDVKEG